MAERNLVEPLHHVDTVLLDDVGRSLTATARRLLEYERFLDGLERLKMRDGALPAVLEQQVARSIQGNLADAQGADRLIAEWTSRLEELGVFQALFSSIDTVIEPGGVPAWLREHGPDLERWIEAQGMPIETWRWALQQADWAELGARVEAGSIVVTRGRRTVAVIAGGRGDAMDAAAYVGRAFGLAPARLRGTGDEALRLSAPQALEAAVQELIRFLGGRARRTAMDGVQVLPTGIWWVVVIVIIAIFLIVAGASITILCDIGSITDRGVCDLGVALLLLGFLVAAVALGGANKTSPDPDDPDPGIPDPPG